MLFYDTTLPLPNQKKKSNFPPLESGPALRQACIQRNVVVMTPEPISEKVMQPLCGSLGTLVLWKASCHVRSPTTLRSSYWSGHMKTCWLTNPAVHPSSHLHQGASEAVLNLLRKLSTSWVLLSHLSQCYEKEKNQLIPAWIIPDSQNTCNNEKMMVVLSL